MTPGEFIEVFDTVTEAPGGIERLRELVLQLAVRGRLVPQDGGEEPASQLLKRIQLEAKKAPKSRVSVEYEPDIDLDMPRTWESVSIGDAMALVNGRAFKPGEWSATGLPIVRIQNLNDPSAPYNYCDFSVAEKFYIDTGDLLLSWSGTPGTSFGAHIWNRGRAVLNQHIFRCEPRGEAFFVPYLRLAINSRLSTMIERAHGGVGLRHITKGKLQSLLLALPPLAEQHRIVAKVDELMGLIDRLAAARRSREDCRTAARDSALAALRNASTSEDVETAWMRIVERMDDLFSAPADLTPLREAVLQLAVRGKLVPQDADEELPISILECNAKKKKYLVDQRKISNPKSIPRLSLDEVPFNVPETWQWIRLGDVSLVVMGNSPPGSSYNEQGLGVPLINGPVEFSAGAFGLTICRKYTTKPNQICTAGDMLICVRGATTGRTNIAAFDACIGRGVALVRAWDAQRYVNLYLWHVGQEFLAAGKGTTFPSISYADLAGKPLPLPPLAEQHRIVAKVDGLMGLIDRLEQHLVAKEEYHEALAAAVDPHRDVTGSGIDLGVA